MRLAFLLLALLAGTAQAAPRSITAWADETGGPSTTTIDLGVEDTDWVAGDLAQCFLGYNAGGYRTFQTLTGWTKQVEIDHSSEFIGAAEFTRVLQTGDGNPTFSLESGASSGGGFCYIWEADSLDATSAGDDGTGTSYTAPDITTTTDNATSVRFFFGDDTTNTITPAEGTATGTLGSEAAATYQTEGTAGAIGTSSATGDGTDWVAISSAIAPSSVCDITQNESASIGQNDTVPLQNCGSSQSLSIGGETFTAQSGSDSTQTVITLPTMADWITTYPSLPLESAQTVVVDGVTSSFTYTFNPESGSTLYTMACDPGSCPDTDSIFNCPTENICTEAFPSGYVTGDQFVFEPLFGGPSFNEYGVLTCTERPCSANIHLRDSSASMWTESVSVGMSAACNTGSYQSAYESPYSNSIEIAICP